MDLPKPPEDQELRNIIDKLAQFVARNGPEFEQMTKNKQKDNPKFGFLFGGDYFNYYQYKVTTEQAILKQKQKTLEQHQQQVLVQHAITQQSIQTAPWQPHLQQQHIQEQIHQSECNLAAQHHVLMQQQQIQVDEAIRQAQDDKLQMLAKECDVDISEADRIMQPIIESCTKDSISVETTVGKSWIFNTSTTPGANEVIARYLVKRITALGSPFELKLHLVYLINDVLHHWYLGKKNAEDLKRLLGTVVIPIFCTTSIGANDDQKLKLSKLLKLWESNKYFSPLILEQLKTPATSLTAYQAGLITEYSNVVTPITAAIQTQFVSLQKQHQDFVTHITAALAQPLMPLNTNANRNVQPQQPQPQQQATGAPQQPQAQPPPLQISPTIPPAAQQGVQQQPPSQQQQRPMTPPPQAQMNPQVQSYSSPQRVPPPSVPVSVQVKVENSTGLNSGPTNTEHLPSSPSETQTTPTNLNSGPGVNFGQPPPNFIPNFCQPPPNFNQPPPGFPPSYPQPQTYNQPLPAGMPPHFPPAGLPLPDLSKPPPGFPPLIPPPTAAQLLAEQNEQAVIPNVPYFELPAGLMTTLVKLEDCEYKALDPNEIVLPPPQAPSERLIAAVELFYTPPCHDRPRNSDGWEQLGLYEFFKAKSQAKKRKEEDIREGIRDRSPRSKSRSRSRERERQFRSWSRSPPRRRYREENRNTSNQTMYNRPRSKSRSKSRSRSRSRSRSPQSPVAFARAAHSKSRSHSRSPSPSHQSSRSRRRSASRSPTPPSFFGGAYAQPTLDRRLDESNKGHQLLKKMGWGGAGLGAAEQGIQDPISGGEVRDRQDQYKGIGINLNDPFESFRKSKGQAFINRMKARAEEKLTK